jgi:penicillin amidase
MRAGLAGLCLVGVLVVGCNGSAKAPSSLTLTPSGTVTVQGPTTFQAVAVETGGPVAWNLAGHGTLSDATGARTTYRPPVTPVPGETATLTVTSGAFTTSATLQLAPPALAAAKIPGLTAAVEVRYDAWQVPHIRCAQAADCFAVQGYLQARDRLFQMDILRRAATGRSAELIGINGLSQDISLRTLFTTRAGERLGDALARNVESATRPKVMAYIAGINARLAELRAAGGPALPGEYAQLPNPVTAADIPDWTLSDLLSFVRLQQYSLSSTLDQEVAAGTFITAYPPINAANLGKLDVWLRSAQPASEKSYTLLQARTPDPLAMRSARPRGAAASALASARAASKGPLGALSNRLVSLREVLKPLDGTTGSNNWVVDAAHSATGKAMVANDPHLSLRYPPNFYLAALTSSNPADNLDVTGGSFPGTPGAQVGRGKNVGWGVTVVGYDVTDIYQEQFLPSCPGSFPYCVLFNAAPVNLIPVPISFKVRVGPGNAGLVDAGTLGLPVADAPPAAALIVPHHGPIIQAPDALGKAFSVRWTGHEDNTQDLTAFLGLNTATSVDTAMAALAKYSTGAQNFVLADDAGHIAYDPHALVPKRPWAGTAPAGVPLLPWFPLPGDGSAEWGTGVAGDHCAASGTTEPAAACWIADADLPQGKDPAEGFFITANADPVGASDGNPPLPTYKGNYLSFNWDDSTAFRHARITERMKAALVAGGGKVSQADMESIQTDHVSRMGAAFQRYIAAMPADSPTNATTTSYEGARAVLATWKTGKYDCPSGLTGIDPKTSPADTDTTVSANSAGCYLFHEFVRDLLKAVFTDDLAVAKVDLDGVNAVKGMLHMLDNPPGSAAPADQSFCSDVAADGDLLTATTCEQQVRTALVTAFDTLTARLKSPALGQWLWGRVHTFQPVSEASPLVSLGYSPGPFARPGGAFTVDVASPSLSGSGTKFDFGSSGNVRHVSVMDPAAPRVRMQLPGPEASQPYGVGVGPDLLADWARNTYFDYAHGDQILGTTVATRTFTAP